LTWFVKKNTAKVNVPVRHSSGTLTHIAKKQKGVFVVIQWIGVILTIVGLAINGYKEYNTNNNSVVKENSTTNTANRYQYLNIVVAYDCVNKTHLFQHLDGKWYSYPPVPNL